MFSTGFGPPCQWVNQGPTELVSISHEALHSYPLWPGYRIPLSSILSSNNNTATLVIGNDQIVGRIESQVGDAMVDGDGYWASAPAVHVTRTSAQRSHVDLDLKGDVSGCDPDIDVDFDLDVGTHKDTSGRWFLDVVTANPDANVGPTWCGIWQWLPYAMSAGAEFDGPESNIESALYGAGATVGIGQIYDVQASFDANDNLVIVATLQCPQTDPILNTCTTGTYHP